MKLFFLIVGHFFFVSNIANANPASQPAQTSKQHKSKAATKWIHNDLATAYQASAGKRPIIVLTNADWCPPCKQLMYEVIHAPVGQNLLKKAVCVSVNFETKEGRKATKRYRVLGLPTTLVLSPKGREIGRIVGYPGKRVFQESLKDLLAGKSNLQAILKAYKAHPTQPKAILAYAQAKLVRGHTKEAKKLLLRVFSNKDPKNQRTAQRAARVWGRYLLRVKRNAKAGTKHFLKAMNLFKTSSASKGFLYWAAKGYALQKKPKKALKLFDRWIKQEPGKIGPLLAKADFMLHQHYAPLQAEKLVRRALKQKPHGAWLHYMLAQAKYQQKDLSSAKVSIQTAIRLKPKIAIFRYYARKLK